MVKCTSNILINIFIINYYMILYVNNIFFYRYNLGNDVQFYSVFPPNYIKPIYKKDEQELIYKNTKTEQLIHAPIKPASNFETCSEFHDILVR